METGENPLELCYLIDTARQLQQLQQPILNIEPDVIVRARYEGEELLRKIEQTNKPDSIFIASEGAFYDDELHGYTDIVKERKLDMLKVLGKYGWIGYIEQFDSFTVTVHHIQQAKTRAFQRSGGEILPSPLYIPVLNIVHAVAA